MSSSSSLRASVLKSRIARLPHLPAIHPTASTSGGGESATSVMAPPTSSPDTLSLGSPRRASSSADPTADAFAPISAGDCFEQALEVDVTFPEGSSSTTGTFRVYYTPPRLRKGARKAAGGRSKSSAALAIDGMDLDNLRPPTLNGGEGEEAEDDPDEEDDGDEDEAGGAGSVMVLHHGAGFGGLSYALVAREITRLTKGKLGVLSIDCRGHGRTRVEPPGSSADMSLETIAADLLLVLRTMFGSRDSAGWPKLVFVGHSMGGSVVTKAVEQLLQPSASTPSHPPPSVLGLAVLDVVEGTAIEALDGMAGIVKAQPTGFASVEDAIRWHVDTGVLMNIESARRSVPSLVVANANFRESAGAAAAPESEEDEEVLQDEGDATTSAATVSHEHAHNTAHRHKYKWKADLLATQPYWRGWFEGMSQRFLTSRTARLLLLAGTDRLDKDLMIGQMQGKYQLVVFPEVGHCLHEDAPERTAQVLVEFWRRNQQSVVPVAKLRHLQQRQARPPQRTA